MKGFPAQPARDALEALAAERQLTISDCARVLGIDRSTIQRLYRRDRLRYDAADHIAVTLGRHPYELWPTWFTSAALPAPADRAATRPGGPGTRTADPRVQRGSRGVPALSRSGVAA